LKAPVVLPEVLGATASLGSEKARAFPSRKGFIRSVCGFAADLLDRRTLRFYNFFNLLLAKSPSSKGA
jgi:hypothetical protein